MRSTPTALLLGAALVLAGPAFAADAAPKAKEGDKVPAIELPATQVGKALPDHKDAKTLNLKDLQGKKNIVLFFYPRALTKGCTIESCGFRDVVEKFAGTDTVIIGVSTDTLEKQQEFTDKEKLNFPLLADNDLKLSKALGVPLGKKSATAAPAASRWTFVIDKKGTIRKIYTTVKPGEHPKEVFTFVQDNLASK